MIITANARKVITEMVQDLLAGKSKNGMTLLQGCCKLWREADDMNLLALPEVQSLVQLEIELDRQLKLSKAKERALVEQAFEADKRAEIIFVLKSLLLRMGDPALVMSTAATLYLSGEMDSEMAFRMLVEQIRELGLQEEEPFVKLYINWHDLHDLPSDRERYLWHPDLLKQKEVENRELIEWLSESMRLVCTYILEHPRSVS